MISRWIKRLFLAFAVICSIALLILHLSSSFLRFSDSKVPSDLDILRCQYNDTEIRYLKNENPTSNDLIIFVHGAPGSAGDLSKYLQSDLLQKRASLISIDRLGYGYSDYGNTASISEQVDLLRFIVDKEGNDKNIFLVGHSYGGPIVGAYASAFETEGIVLLASVIDPYNEKIFWFSYLSFWKTTKWVFPKYIKVAGAEKKAHEKELLKIKDIWSDLKVPVIMVHDSTDYIAPGMENITWASEQINDSLFYFHSSNDSHFIPFTNEELTTSMILKLLTINNDKN